MTFGGGDRRSFAVADVLAVVVSRGDRSTWPATLVVECAAAMGVAGVGLAVADESGPVGVLAATAGAGRDGEDLQFSLGEGPCRTAAVTRRTTHAPDLTSDQRWVHFGRAAADTGIRAASSVPLQVGAVLVGVLDVYRDAPGPLSDDAARHLSVHSQVATAVLLLLTAGDERPGEAAGLLDLADIRPVVHQAAGMVAVQLEVDLAVALLHLRAHAFGTGRPLRDLAGDVVARRVRFDDHDLSPDLRPDDGPDRGPVQDPFGPPDAQQRNPDEHP